ncbi:MULTISPECIES: TetR/AcrR family transcriptional regulator [Xanthomonas]|nr:MULTISPECIES: TetR/AcrR family transcriptional regulator [Xanthomonas]KAA8921712.1 TetR family transcriptional regulator [Xanthomonas sontii]KAB7771200.1 TetR/AcrR family transcriptional regulator [Xanthomonas sp. LMG 12461]KAB7773544.1 TetR family transcriptional regulator [Xanthomonas sp. LMG 12462]UYK84185.1 TetR/AcrR family transcriptional regulator [Xanthomonas sacchari]
MPRMEMRADTAHRRRLLLDAADEVFCAHGVLAPLELVVERAGLGRATLYRHFADRTELMAALLERGLDGLEGCAREIGTRPDGLFLLMYDVAEHIAMSAPLADYWRSMPREHPTIAAAHTRAMAILLPYLQRAIAAGLCRPDLGEQDLALAMDMLGACQRGSDEAERKALAQRCCRLLCHALATPAAAAEL